MKPVTIVTSESVTCPRCGQQTIRTKDWGQAGMLFVHKDTVENGVPIQDACRLTRAELTNGATWTSKR